MRPALRWIGANRLKAVSVLAVSGDALMGLAGTSHLFSSPAPSVGGTLLAVAGFLAMAGHMCLFIWGKGAKSGTDHTDARTRLLPVWFRPLVPWHYPLDSAFFVWVAAGVLYTSSGIAERDLSMTTVGVLVVSAASTGWLWPQERPIFGLPPMRFTAGIYMMSTLATFWAAISMGNLVIFLAAMAYGACNVILATVRKTDQSAFTQKHSS